MRWSRKGSTAPSDYPSGVTAEESGDLGEFVRNAEACQFRSKLALVEDDPVEAAEK